MIGPPLDFCLLLSLVVSWKQISPDLTTNDKSRQKSSGGPITQDNTSVEYYCTIFTAAESPYEKDLLWTGSDDGLIHVSRDGGKAWDNVTPKDAPKWIMWNCIDSDPFKKGAAYLTGTRYKSDDFAPYIYKTEDYGKSWKLIVNGISKFHFTRTMRADKLRPGLLYAGTEYGMYISYDDGANWKKFQLNLPAVPITDLTIKNNDLVVATQGRSFWVLDDLSVLQGMNESTVKSNIHLFDINAGYRMRTGGGNPANLRNAGANPSNGVVMNYYVKDVPDSAKISLAIFDAAHKHVKTFTTDAKEANEKIEVVKGMNQFAWDLQYPGGDRIDNMILWNGVPGSIVAPPGTYYARIKYGADSIEKKITLLPDPNYKISGEQYKQQFDFLIQVRDKFNEIQKAIKDIRALRTQINDFVGRQDKEITKTIKPVADSINKKLTAIEETLYQTKSKSSQDVLNFPIRLNDKLSGLFDAANSGNMPPAQQVRDVYTDLAAQTDAALARFKKVKEEDVRSFNQLIREKALPTIGLKEESKSVSQ